MLLGVVPAAVHVFEAPLGGDRLGGLEPCAGVRDQADPGEDLIRLDDDVVAAVDPLDPRRTIAERPIDAGLPQIGRFEHVRVGRENQGQHRHLLSRLIAGNTFGNRPIAVKASAVSDSCPAAVKVGLGATSDRRTVGSHVIHSVTDPLGRLTAAIHVYGGDFYGAKRSDWDSPAHVRGSQCGLTASVIRRSGQVGRSQEDNWEDNHDFAPSRNGHTRDLG